MIKNFKKFLCFAMLMNIGLYGWTFQDDGGKHPMKDPAPSEPKSNSYYADVFYESTDDPNVWIEHHDEEFDDFDEWPV